MYSHFRDTTLATKQNEGFRCPICESISQQTKLTAGKQLFRCNDCGTVWTKAGMAVGALLLLSFGLILLVVLVIIASQNPSDGVQYMFRLGGFMIPALLFGILGVYKRRAAVILVKGKPTQRQ